MLTSVGHGPADDLADLRLPVPVQHHDAEPIGEAARLDRRQRRRDAAHVAQRCKVLDPRVVEHLLRAYELGRLLKEDLAAVGQDDLDGGPGVRD